MKKLKATKKEMREKHDYILSIDSCDMQSLLNKQRAFAYSARAEGWACDYYKIGDVLISEGYASLNDKNMKSDYHLIREYEQKSMELDLLGLYAEERQNKRQELLKELLNKMKKPMEF